LILIDVIAIFATVASLRVARRIWNSNIGWSDVTTDISGRSNESRIRINATTLANAIGLGAFSVAGALAVAADGLGRSTAARIALILSALFGVAFLVFTSLAVSIYQRNKPKRLIPPSLRNR
jgi:hypothetical protein